MADRLGTSFYVDLDVGLDDLEAVVHLSDGAHVGNRIEALAQEDVANLARIEWRRGSLALFDPLHEAPLRSGRLS